MPQDIRAIETVGKVLILVPTFIALILLIYANITGKSVSAGCSGFCIGTIIVCGLVLVVYAAVKEFYGNAKGR